MKYAIQSKGDDRSNETRDKIIRCFEGYQIEYDDVNPDIVITVGGDGTLLHAFHQYLNTLQKIAFVGVHTGHLGFYADWRTTEIEELVYKIVHDPLRIVRYPLLEVVIKYHNGKPDERYLALNECTVKSEVGSVVMDIKIKDDLFETFRGDGLCISTPSGSTAYNKSLTGAIIHPSIEAIQLAEMASINNRVYRTIGSPLVMPKEHVLKLYPLKNSKYHISIDHIFLVHNDVKSIHCRVAPEKIQFARIRSFPFWNRVRDSFIGKKKDI
ncbi:NAD kinase [Terrilactibacillus sp. BCM23-1]|uniref:NAD kinase n=1 Tax=Terrilactibacillus tamarindi TaxID=2599694 RepID=A0A6N8CNB2_9BACI|nr:NAD kinase [Terrilactibacillus tamarindi]MTT30583.1 NAD kinase [Terrilactibacillus tamarindi]